MKNNFNYSDLIRIKSELICYGIQPNSVSEKIYDIEHKTKVKRTSNMGLQLFFNEDIIVSVPYNKENLYNSKYYLYEADDKLFLTDGIAVIEVKPYPFMSPSWYDYELANGKYISDYIQKEGRDVLICSVTESCCYFSKNEECTFCSLNSGSSFSEKGRITTIIEAFKIVLGEDKDISSINLTGGNLYSEDKGAFQYIDIVKAIREVSNVPIVVEMSPPDDLNILEDFYNIGVTAVEFNIEVWDEKIRNIIIPGKAKIKREHYVNAWKRAVEIFGLGNVGSGIIIGLENTKSSLEGIKQMIMVGCLPSIIPFKPTEGSILENFPKPNPNDIIDVTTQAVALLKKESLSPINGPGCIGCGACTLESDVYRSIK